MEYVKYAKSNRNYNDYIFIFEKHFKSHNELTFVRAPGRVNIIGEHIDYCGYSVMPMAIENDILMIFSTLKGGHKIYLRNINELYEPFEVDASDIKINDLKPKWYDYFLCGYRGIMDYAKENKLSLENHSLSVLVDGNIPPNSGLSSSSALVVCSALVTMKSLNLNIPTRALAKLCANCEKYIGTQGGGMDQTISLMANANSAMIIDFSLPEFQIEKVSLPESAIFVVTNSMEQMNKASTNQFNQRVVESRLSAKVLLALLQPDLKASEFNRLIDVQKQLCLDFSEMLEKIEKNLKKTYSKEELMSLLHLSDDSFKEQLSKNTQEMTEFHLYNRAKHVISEANRVIEFKKLCTNGCGDGNILEEMGKLMNDSQSSCRDLYDCSSETLDKLVDLCRKAGSYGSRLTGAGWGGCVISLLSKERIDDFLNYVADNFYHESRENISSLMFVSKPSDGASFFC